jgi:Zn-dependent peptidase ImmA (M78 family)/DNA-binding XRE family transcriptional regulator
MNNDGMTLGLRLQEGREARTLTQVELAGRVGLTRATISAYEKGLRTPSIETLNHIAGILDLPLSYFRSERPNRERRNTPVSYRRKSRASLGRMRRVERYEEWLADIYAVFTKYVAFPKVNLTFIEEYEKLEEDQIEDVASEIRSQWGMGIGPVADLTAFAEANGIVVGRADFEQDVDGVSDWRGDRPFVVLNSRVSSCARQRFNLAHELGHLVLHRLADEIEFEKQEHHKHLEEQANRFAQAFLFPLRAYSREVPNMRFDYLIEVKRRWKVSMQAIVMRGKTLGIIDEYQVGYFYRQLSERGFSRTHEPLDNELQVEAPALFSRAAKMLADQDNVTLLDLVDDSVLSVQDFCVLTGIDPAILSNRPQAKIFILNRSHKPVTG